MTQHLIFVLCAGLALTGCTIPAPKAKYISTEPAAEDQIAAARNALELCARLAPDWRALEAAYRAREFGTPVSLLSRMIARERRGGVFLQDQNSDVLVQIGQSSIEGACIVGLPGMTPDQSLALATPIADQFGALTNAQRGSSLSRRAAQAWMARKPGQIIFLSASKAWETLGTAGASVRLLIVNRD